MPTPPVHGRTAPGFESVRAAFADNLAQRGELGGACALVRGDEVLVDLWGGVRDARTRAPWVRPTVVLAYSVTKGITAAALAWLHARGRLDYEQPVAELWPAFAAHGKEAITVRTLLAHQAGLSGLDRPLTPQLVGDLDALAHVLAAQRPAWVPGSRHAYHALSLGFYANEIARRVDVAGRSLRAIVREELARPLGVRLSIGVPADLPASRIASIEPLNPWKLFAHPRDISPRFGLALAWPWSQTARSVRNPKLRGPAELDAELWRGLELPASNGYATDGFTSSFSGGVPQPIKMLQLERPIEDFLSALVADQLFHRFPNLRVASVENGSGFLRGLFHRLEALGHKMAGWFPEDPVETFRRHIWINPFWEDDVHELLDLMGPERVIFGSDWPHIEGMPRPLDYLEELTGLEQKVVDLIVRENVAELNELRPT